MSPATSPASNRTRPSASRRSWSAIVIGLIVIAAVGLVGTELDSTRYGAARQTLATVEGTAPQPADLGAIPDLANGGFYALQGDWGNAAFSLAAAVPLAGDVLGAGKLALKYGDDVAAFAANIGSAVGAATTRYRDNAASALTRGPDDVAAGAGDGLLSPGPHAGRSISGDATRDFTRQQRDELNNIMSETGCHRCGAKSPGTKSGDAIPDHQPPLSQSGGPYELYPHCKTCSWDQLQEIARLRREAPRAARGG